MSPLLLCVHGGSDQWQRERASSELSALVHAGLRRALEAGAACLSAGKPAEDAVQAAIIELENDPAFNAAHGAALTDRGWAECDAALMRGRDGQAAAVAGLRRTRNPISAARCLFDEGRHVLLAGPEGEAWLHAHGVVPCDPQYLWTQRAQDEWEAWRAAQAGRRGTVGAVARDALGNLAAGTSTGGLAGKRAGRIGDSPLVGSGTWADEHAAISCTGLGEAFIRCGFSLRAALAVAQGHSPQLAVQQGLLRVAAYGGTGGCILISRSGEVALLSSDPAMARGTWTPAGYQTWLSN